MNKTVLILAPHNDDELLGAGGTLLKLAKSGYTIVVCEVTSGPNSSHIQAEAQEAHNLLGVNESIFLNLPSCQLDEMPKYKLNAAIAGIIKKTIPEIVLLPHYGDMHLDHRWVAEAAMVAVRPLAAPYVKKILAYETLSETEWNTPSTTNAFIPNVWVDISNEIEQKLLAMKCYRSQLYSFPHPRSLEAIKALSQYRGSTIGAEAAEAFMLIRDIT